MHRQLFFRPQHNIDLDYSISGIPGFKETIYSKEPLTASATYFTCRCPLSKSWYGHLEKTSINSRERASSWTEGREKSFGRPWF